MKLIDTRLLSIDNKTVAQLHEELRRQSHYFRNKWDACFSSRRVNVEHMKFYRNASDTYFACSEVLRHLVTYGSPVSKSRCLSCQHDTDHVIKLQASFKKYYPIIVKCRDGYRYKDMMPTVQTVLTHDV